jgi:iron complex transport system substrate-binding protein
VATLAPDAPGEQACAAAVDLPAPPGARGALLRADPAALAMLRPDVVITAARDDDAQARDGQLESQPKIAALAGAREVAVGARSLADVFRDIRRVAVSLGVPERGLQLVTRLRARLDAVAARAAGSGPRPRVAFVERFEPLTVAGAWTSELIALAGGEDAFGAPGRDAVALRWEDLVSADPELVLVAPRGLDLALARAGMPGLVARRGWGELRAVRENRVYLMDGDGRFARPGPRMAEALEILAETLHPGSFRFGHEGTGWERWRSSAARG